MDLQVGDPETLKNDMLQLLLKYPNGVKFGNFIGAFHQLHRYHPQFSCYGYHSLRHLLDDMKEAVVIEGNSNKAVLKLANGFNLNCWMDKGREENGLDTFEEEDPSLKDERERAALSDVLKALTSLLKQNKSGLMIKKIQKFLLSRYGIDLEKYSNSKGYKDILTFLGCQIPYLNIKYQENVSRCVVQLTKDPTVTSVPIFSILQLYPNGLKMKKLKEVVKKKCGIDLEVFCSLLGYEDVVSYLKEIPGLIIKNSRNSKCTVRCQSRSCSLSSSMDTDCSARSGNTTSQTLITKTSGSSSPDPSLDSDFSDNISNALLQKLLMKKTELAAALVPVLDVLRGYPSGMDLKTLTNSLKKHGFDLKAFSQDMDYEDEMSCLLDLPGLELSFCNGNQPNDCVIKLLSSSLDLPHLAPSSDISGDKFLSSSGSNVSLEPTEADPTSCRSTVFQFGDFLSSSSDESTSKAAPLNGNMLEKNATSFTCVPSQFNNPLSFGSEYTPCKSRHSNQEKLEKNPAELTEVMASLTSLLNKYKHGLRVEKVQEFLLAMEGIDLEKFSIFHGHKDTLEFLELRVPKLNLKYQNNRLKSVVKLGAGAVSKPAFTFIDSSASDFQSKSLTVPVPLLSHEVNKLVHDRKSVSSAMMPNLSSFQEPPDASLVTAKNSSTSSSGVLPQQPKACEFGAESLVEGIPSNYNLITPQSSTVLDELKQQVAQILTMHPNGLSLFQFRAAYSATFEHHFPIGSASSFKQRLLEMPDVVCLKGHGVQILLLPVSSTASPVKSGQPVSSKVENASVVPCLPLQKTGATVKPDPMAQVPGAAQSNPTCTPALDSFGKTEVKGRCIPEAVPLREPQRIPAREEQGKARTGFRDLSDQPDLSKVQKVTGSYSLPKGVPQVVSQPCNRSALPKAAVRSVPQPRHFLLPSPGPIGELENKRNSPFPDLPWDIPVHSVQDRTSHNLINIPFPHHFSAVLPGPPKGIVYGNPLQLDVLNCRPTPLANSDNTDLYPSTCHPVPPASFVAWQQPVLCSSAPFYPGNSAPVSVNCSGSQFQKSTSQSSSCSPSLFPVQPQFPIQTTEQRDQNCGLSGLDPFSQVQKQSRTLQHPLNSVPDSSVQRHSVSSWSTNLASLSPSRSKADKQYAPVGLEDLQYSSVSVSDESIMKTSWDSEPSKHSAYLEESTDVNPLVTSSSSVSYNSDFTNRSQQTLLATSSVTSNFRANFSVSSLGMNAGSSVSFHLDSTTNSLREFAYTSRINSNSRAKSSELFSQREYARTAATVISPDRKASSFSSLSDSATNSSHQIVFDPSRITSNSDAMSSEASRFTDQRQYANATAVSSSKMSRSSVPASLYSTSNLSCSSSAGINYGPVKQNDLKLTFSSQRDHSSDPPQMSYFSLQNSHPPKSHNKCLIL